MHKVKIKVVVQVDGQEYAREVYREKVGSRDDVTRLHQKLSHDLVQLAKRGIDQVQ